MLKKLHWLLNKSNNHRRLAEGVLVCHRDPKMNMTALWNIDFLPPMDSGVNLPGTQTLTRTPLNWWIVHQETSHQCRVESWSSMKPIKENMEKAKVKAH